MFVIVAVCHLALLVLVSGQRPLNQGAMEGEVTNPAVIKLRFHSGPNGSSALSLTIPNREKPVLQQRKSFPKKVVPVVIPGRVAALDIRRSEAAPASAPLDIQRNASAEGTTNDGGFQQRLLEAKPSYGAPRLPGSGTSVVKGIQFVDPMDQGVGAVMRKTQQLFGIKNRHCIDVDTWRSLTPEERSARHVSPDEVDRVDERYACNAPPGLHF